MAQTKCDIEQGVNDWINGNFTDLKNNLAVCNSKQIVNLIGEYIEITGKPCLKVLDEIQKFLPREY